MVGAPQSRRVRMGALALATFVMLLTPGCDDPQCPAAEAFVVNENGTCASTPQQFTLVSDGACRVSLASASGDLGLPLQGAMGPHPVPLRQGAFILYSDSPTFRLCRAQRIDYRLELSCVDANDAPVCQAELTEPGS